MPNLQGRLFLKLIHHLKLTMHLTTSQLFINATFVIAFASVSQFPSIISFTITAKSAIVLFLPTSSFLLPSALPLAYERIPYTSNVDDIYDGTIC